MTSRSCARTPSGLRTSRRLIPGDVPNIVEASARLEGFLAVARLLPLYKNEPIIEYGKRPRFDWKDGLVGETKPDRVLVPAVEPVDLPAFLVELEAAEAGAAIPDEGAEPVARRGPDGPAVFLQIQEGRGVLKIPLSIGEPPDSPEGDDRSMTEGRFEENS